MGNVVGLPGAADKMDCGHRYTPRRSPLHSRSAALRSAAGLLALSLTLGACGQAEEPADPSPDAASTSAPAPETTPSRSRPALQTPTSSATAATTAHPTTDARDTIAAPSTSPGDSSSASPTTATSHTPSPVFPDEPASSTSVHPSGAQSTHPAKSTTPSTPPAPQSSAGVTRQPDASVDCATERCIALTFDDGPATSTGRLLDVLADEGVPATFYVVGRSVANNPDLVTRMAAEGHQVGSHSWSHPLFTDLDPAQIGEELDRTDAAIRAAGVVPSTVRAPYGALDSSVLAALDRRGEGSVTWTVDTRDWEHRDPAQTLAQVQAQARPGAIVLMHDLHTTSVDAAPSVIAWLREQGYTFVTVDQITGGVAPGTTVACGLHP